MNNLKFSIVTVCYNAAIDIEETILSVINQTYNNIEYIIIDGGSTDGTVDIIKKYSNQISYWVSEPDKGIYDAMNKGINKAIGDYINFMNAGDCLYSNSTISDTVNLIKGRPTIIYGDTIIKKSKGNEQWENGILANIKNNMVFCHQSTFIRLDYHKQNPFDTSFKLAADYNFLFNAYKAKEEFQYLPITISIFNGCNGGASTRDHKTRIREKCRIWGVKKLSPLRFKYEIIIALLRIQDKYPILNKLKNKLLG